MHALGRAILNEAANHPRRTIGVRSASAHFQKRHRKKHNMAIQSRLSLKEWQARLDAERAAGLRRGSTLPKPAPRSFEKATTPLSQEPHFVRASEPSRRPSRRAGFQLLR